jgi:hypothetical protein
MRIATYNVEWFDNLFDDAGHLKEDGGWSGRRDVTRGDQIRALGTVFRALDADAVMIIEAPDQSRRRSTTGALLSFARHFGLRLREALIGYPTETQQEIALLYDPDVMSVIHDPMGDPVPRHGSRLAPRFDGTFRPDLDVDGMPDHVTWSKPPLEVSVTPAHGLPFRLIGVHAKSKAPHGARSEPEVTRLSIENRHKQLAQCLWLRARVEEHLSAGDPLIVLGDFNDGPGLDQYEQLFNRSGVEIVLGERDAIRLHDPHAQQILSSRIAAAPSSARFRLPPDGRFLSALLDYVMVSPDLMSRNPRWHIWHPFDDPVIYRDPALREALLTASDHFPVTINLDLSD